MFGFGPPPVKVIRHNVRKIEIEDDPSYPFKLEITLSPPEFMIIAFICMFGGSEEIVLRGMTRKALEKVIQENNFPNHPRILRMVLSGPDGVIQTMDSAKVAKPEPIGAVKNPPLDTEPSR